MQRECQRNSTSAGVEILRERFQENTERQDDNRTCAKKQSQRARSDNDPTVKEPPLGAHTPLRMCAQSGPVYTTESRKALIDVLNRTIGLQGGSKIGFWEVENSPGIWSPTASVSISARSEQMTHLAVICSASRNTPGQLQVVKPSLQIDRHHIRRLAIDREHDRNFTGAGQ